MEHLRFKEGGWKLFDSNYFFDYLWDMADYITGISMDFGSESLDIFSTAAQASLESTDGTGEPNDNISSPGPISFWCYFCFKYVSVDPDSMGENMEMVCSECHSGFIEAVNTTEHSPAIQRARNRRRRRAGSSSMQSFGSVESLHSHNLSQRSQLHGQTSNRNTRRQQPGQESDFGLFNSPSSRSYSRRRAASDYGSESFDNNSFIDDSDTNITLSGHGGFSDGSDDLFGEVQSLLDGETFLASQDNESHVGGGSESGGFGTVGMSLYEWDSVDDDDGEWEAGREEDSAFGNSEGIIETVREARSDPTEQSNWLRSRRERWRFVHMRHRQGRPTESNLNDNLLEEASFEGASRQLSFRIQEEYVDLSEQFDQIIRFIAESTNDQGNTSGTADSVIENLSTVTIGKEHECDGYPVCPICKDPLLYGSEAKQLPCSHLYHIDCILPWLQSKNTCPVCRYELPTNDYENEDQRGLMDRTSANDVNQSINQESYFEMSAEDDEQTDDGQSDLNDFESLIVLEQNRDDLDNNGIGTSDSNTRENSTLQPSLQIADDGGRNSYIIPDTSGRHWINWVVGPVVSILGLAAYFYFQNSSTGDGGLRHGMQDQQFSSRLSQPTSPSQLRTRKRWWNLLRR